MNDVIATTGLTIDVSTGGRTVSVVRDLTFALREGEILGIVGESGSGKSMTARALMRLLPRNAQARGEVLVNGRDVLAMDAAGLRDLRRNELAMVFQDPRSHIDPLYSAGDHMTEALRVLKGMDRRSARARCVELLESVGITDSERVFAAYPFELSGGMLQRVMIATALAVDPAIVIADEPTTALDVTIQAEIMALILDLRERRNLSVVFITHDLDLAATACDRILVMYAGQVMEVHQASTVFTDPLHPYTAALHRARAAIEHRSERMNAIPGAPPNPFERPAGCPFHPRCQFAEPACRETVPDLRQFGSDAAACLRTEELRGSLLGGARVNVAVETLLDVEALSKTFVVKNPLGGERNVNAVREVSFSLVSGGSLAIVGESGSGKTTVARMLCGLVSPTEGQIRLAGSTAGPRPSRAERLARGRLLQMVFQDPYASLDPRQSLWGALDEVQQVYFSRGRKERDGRTAALVAAVGLSERDARVLPRELSGGQRQRAAIARALVPEPRIVVLDEAVSALDVSIQAQILNLLADLRHEFDLAYILISHDLAVVRQLTDDLVVMYNGRIVERGPVESVFAAPAHPYTTRLLDSVPRPGLTYAKRDASRAPAETGCAYRSRCPHAHARCETEPTMRAADQSHAAACWLLDE